MNVNVFSLEGRAVDYVGNIKLTSPPHYLAKWGKGREDTAH